MVAVEKVVPQKRLTPNMIKALQQVRSEGHLEGIHSETVEGLLDRKAIEIKSPKDILLTDSGKALLTAELIKPANEVFYSTELVGLFREATVDWTRTDYAFWDSARRGKAKGYELSGLFLKPLGSKISAWVMNNSPEPRIEDDEYTQEELVNWITENHPDILRAFEESLQLGDVYLLINGDESITVLPPNIVKPLVADDNYSKVIGYTVTEVYMHPTNRFKSQTIIDSYTPGQRVRKIYSESGGLVSTTTYMNGLDEVPIVHIANNRGVDEKYGHPEGEPLLTALVKYNDLFFAGAAGNLKQGRPTPVIDKMGTLQQVQKFWEQFGEQKTQVQPDGTTKTYWVLPLDTDNVITLGGEAEFNWKAPGSSSGDTATFLGLLFYLILQHSEIPEYIWGNAIQGSKASADSQFEPFLKWLEKKRVYCKSWLTPTVRIVAKIKALYDRRIKWVGDSVVRWYWPAITSEDSALITAAAQYAHQNTLVSDVEALRLLPLGIENPEEMVEAAQEEARERQEEFELQLDATLARLGQQEAADEDEEDEDSEEDVGTEMHWVIDTGGFITGKNNGNQVTVKSVSVPRTPIPQG